VDGPTTEPPKTKSQRARELLRSELARPADGPYPWIATEVLTQRAARRGIGWRTLYRAAKLIGVQRRYEGRGVGRRALWSLEPRSFLGWGMTRTRHTAAPGPPQADLEFRREFRNRVRGDITQRRLSFRSSAERLGISWGRLERWLYGRSPTFPQPELVARLHTELGLDLNRLFAGDRAARDTLPTRELEKHVFAWLVMTLEGKLLWPRGDVRQEVKELGELLPYLLRCSTARIRRRHRRPARTKGNASAS